MSKIAENKAKEIYPEIEGSETYFDRDYICTKPIDLNRQRREGYVKGYEQAMQDLLKDANQYMYLSNEIGYAYACGCKKTMQDFLNKACEWLEDQACYYSHWEYNGDTYEKEIVVDTDKMIEQFKNYMQDE